MIAEWAYIHMSVWMGVYAHIQKNSSIDQCALRGKKIVAAI